MKKKFLMIIGSITAFILSAVGIIHLMNMTRPVCEYGVPSDPNSIELKNAKIECYSGKINGKDLKLLIRTINEYNANEIYSTDLIINDSSNARITLVNSKYSGDNIVDSNLYKITLDYDENEGYITNVNVSDIKGDN